MSILIYIPLILALLAVVFVLFGGLLRMTRGGDGGGDEGRDGADGNRTQQFMRWRVLLQAIAVAIFVVILLLTKG